MGRARAKRSLDLSAGGTDEYNRVSHLHDLVVVAGALTFGMGDKLMKDAGNKTLGVGGFALMPANMNHFAYTTAAETTIVLYGQGPVEFKYVNPADDLRNQKKPTQ